MATKKKRTTKARKTTTKKATTKKRTTAKRKTAAKTKAKKTTARKTTAKKKTSASKTANVIKFPTSVVTQKQTKAQIFAELAESCGLKKSDVKNLFSALRNLVERHLKSKGSGQFIIPELGVKIRRVAKKATKARKGRNPFTGEEMMIAAKPAHKVVRATVLKNLKEVV